MATTATPQALRDLANLIETAGVPVARIFGLYFTIGLSDEQAREAFRAARALPGAAFTSDANYVTVTVPLGEQTIDFEFSQSALGSMRTVTVTREVTEFVLDPELLDEPVAS